MRAHFLQHVAFEGPGSTETWLREAGWTTRLTRLFAGDAMPDPGSVDFLFVLGGPMSVNDRRRFPWLTPEKAFIREVMAAGTPVLGVCLGAQLIASALGAPVYPNRQPEIGWFPVERIPVAEAAVFPFPSTVKAFHWHGETFDLPAGALRLARSAGCENQAFQIGRRVIGLQFHLETTPAAAAALVANCRGDLSPAQYVQSEVQILAAREDDYRAINGLMGKVLDYLESERA